MDAKKLTPQAPPRKTVGLEESKEVLPELDEEPDELKSPFCWYNGGFSKAKTPSFSRRESLLTRQFHLETEHTDDEQAPQPLRALSTQSNCSTQSATSMGDLMSDDGRSAPSPALSPPLSPVHADNTVPPAQKPVEQNVKIVDHDDIMAAVTKEVPSEKAVEAGLGRKRCISFACKGKQEVKQAPPPPPAEATRPQPASPPKRKCMIKFACPSKAFSSTKPAEPIAAKRPATPPPTQRRSSSSSTKYSGSDRTVTHVSPKNILEASSASTTESVPVPAAIIAPNQARRFSVDSNADSSGNEATRFHEFGTSEDEPEEWIKESTCHKTRLTVNDTLKKEIDIRQTCEKAEEEALEEEEAEEEEEEEEMEEALADPDPDDEDDQVQEEIAEDDHESDEGFHSDDEHGFAGSDSEGDDSEYEWWKPAPTSTAATSVEHLDRLAIVNSRHPEPGSSAGSVSSTELSPRTSRHNFRKTRPRHGQTPAVSINKREEGDLPDSTDFVCGTLDEDRPLEQAFINRLKKKQAAKRGIRPQDIDPTFPASDPEMDEEDDDDVDEIDASEESDHGDLMHGTLEELDGDSTLIRSPTLRTKAKTTIHRSPPPPARLRSPAPIKRRSIAHSPPPPLRRGTARSPPPPAKLFGRSPKRMRSPAPLNRMTSPPNSPIGRSSPLTFAPRGLAGRPQPTHTASLPRGGGLTLSKLATVHSEDEDSDTAVTPDIPKRGAIDIVKGLEKKREIRKKKLHQKMCAKAAAKGEKIHKVKPGRGAERMREVGLQLQQYHGKAEHILSL